MKQFVLANLGKASNSFTDAYLADVLPKCHGAWIGDRTESPAFIAKLRKIKSTLKILLYHDPLAISESMLYYPGVREEFYRKDVEGNKVFNSTFNIYYSNMLSPDWRSYSTSYITMRVASLGLDGVFVDEATGGGMLEYIQELQTKCQEKWMVIPNCRSDRYLEYAPYIDGYFEEDNSLYLSSGKKYAEVFIR